MALQGINFQPGSPSLCPQRDSEGDTAQSRTAAVLCSPSAQCCHNSLGLDVLVSTRGQDARYSTSYCCFLSGKSIGVIFFIYIEGQNGP